MKFNLKLEEIKYAKVSYKDNSGSSCSKKVAVKTINEREILACAKFEENLNIDSPQEVVLSIVCNEGLYKTKTILKALDNDEPYLFIVLETPKGVEFEQNREYFRVSADFNCIYKIMIDDELKEFEAKTIDISANGVSILLPINAVADNFADIVMAINGKLVQSRVRYVRTEKLDEGYKLSFTFTKISESDRDYISQVCLQKQLAERRNSIR